MREAYARRHPTRPVVFVRVSVRAEAPWFWQGRWPPDRLTGQPMHVSDIIFAPLPFFCDLSRSSRSKITFETSRRRNTVTVGNYFVVS